MAWWIWVAIGVSAAILIADWVIVMGADPRKWKGGIREYEHSGVRRQPDSDSEE